MKRNQIITTFAVTLSLSMTATFASPCRTNVPVVNLRAGNVFNGPTECLKGDTTIKQVNGPLNTKATTFKHALLINGVLNATHGTTFERNLKVNGPVNLIDSTAKHVFINGPLNAVNTKMGHLNIASDYVKLIKSTADSIIVRTSEPKDHTAKVYLEDGSIVTGNITFKGPQSGIVYIKGVHTQFKGKVVNGQRKMLQSKKHQQ